MSDHVKDIEIIEDDEDKERSPAAAFWADLKAALKKVPVIGAAFDDSPKVAVIRLSGIISDSASPRRPGISHYRFAKPIEKAFEKPGIKAVVLAINSPGGSAAQSALIGNLIRQLAEEKERPVYAFVEDVAASGGYWLACAADEIYAQDSSIIGSIGVISASFGFEDFIERHGIHRRVHTAGKQKSVLDPFQPERAEDVRRLKIIQADIHTAFIEWVKTRRGERLQGEEEDMFEGQFWAARAALENGTIDAVGDMRAVMREKYGDKVKLVEFAPDKPRFPLPLPFGMQQLNLAEDLVDTMECRALWGRYGL